MSRTDKDTPAWVFARYYEPAHDVRCEEYVSLYYQTGLTKRPCDLPDEPRILHHSTLNPRWRPNVYRSCTWEPDVSYYRYDTDNGRGAYWWTSPPKWYVDHVWNNLNRRRSRDELRSAVKEYNATGEVDVVPNIDQHHHCAKWMWE